MSVRRHRIPPEMLERSRELRREMPAPERLLWNRLRRDLLDGLHFRRQHVIGPYVADFYCPQARLIIEIDGQSHYNSGAHDEARTRFIEAAGYRVIRFANEDVTKRMDVVLATILREAQSPQTSGASPAS